jgi:hypothetical protein
MQEKDRRETDIGQERYMTGEVQAQERRDTGRGQERYMHRRGMMQVLVKRDAGI